MRIVFMGTPDFAVGALDALVAAGHDVAAVVTQPDKPKGRGKAVIETPVKARASELGLTVYQPVKVKASEFVEQLRQISPDVIVVVAFGQLLPKDILDLPPYGCVNIHASLLPKYRGAAPIQWAIIDGETETGITTMLMDTGLDTGDMLEKAVIPIAADETGGSLHDKLSEAGAELIISTLAGLEQGRLTPIPQVGEDSCYAKMLQKTLGDIDWSQDARTIERLIRGLNPWPSAYTMVEGKTLKIWLADVIDGEYPGVCGEVAAVCQDCFLVKTGKDLLAVKEVQVEGKKRMPVSDFMRGFSVANGMKFERRN